MAKKNKSRRTGIVFSTDPDHNYEYESDNQEETMAKSDQKLRVMIDRKKRRGKEVTLVVGYVGNPQDIKELGKLLKSKCGVGGSVKDKEIIIQGNQRDKVVKLLLEQGYTQTKASGG